MFLNCNLIVKVAWQQKQKHRTKSLLPSCVLVKWWRRSDHMLSEVNLILMKTKQVWLAVNNSWEEALATHAKKCVTSVNRTTRTVITDSLGSHRSFLIWCEPGITLFCLLRSPTVASSGPFLARITSHYWLKWCRIAAQTASNRRYMTILWLVSWFASPSYHAPWPLSFTEWLLFSLWI